MDERWLVTAQALKSVYGQDVLSLSKDKAMVKFGASLVAIAVPDPDKEDAVRLSFRASLWPNDVAVISIIISSNFFVVMDNPFEFPIDGPMVVGQQALEEAAKIMSADYGKSIIEPKEFSSSFLESQRQNPN